MRVRSAHVAQVRGDHGARIDDGVSRASARDRAPTARSTPLPCRTPGRASRCRSSLPNTLPGIDRELALGIDHALAHRHAGEIDAIGVRRQVEVVADVHGLHQEAEILRELAAHAVNARQQIAALRLVDQRHQAIADFQADDVDRLHVFPRQLARFGRRRRCWRRRSLDRRPAGLSDACGASTRRRRRAPPSAGTGRSACRGSGPSRRAAPPRSPARAADRTAASTSSPPMSWARDMRVTMIATAVESSSAGICATRPSPIVSSV